MEEFKKPCLPTATSKHDKPCMAVANEDMNKINDPVREIEDKILLKPLTQTCPYKIPTWSNRPSLGDDYGFEVLKSGQIIDEIKELQKKAYWTFGRLPENDIEMAHPTISRFHAILQYRPNMAMENFKANEEETNTEDSAYSKGSNLPPEGWYIYDLESTHGTFLNKQRLPAKVYIRIKVGHMLRLGASTRTYILQGPTEDEEPESELSVTELKAKRQKELEEAIVVKKLLAEEAATKASNEGCSWGMTEDADEDTDLTHNPYACSNNEELFLEDPKKTLRGYFEREGTELVYKCDEMSVGSFVCRVELPLDDENGRPIIAEVVHKGRKKDCVVQCALEACRLLDRHGVLRQANQEPLKRKQKANNSDSDDDEFWDRTGDVARKKQRKAKASASVTLTYDDLLKQESDLKEQLKQIQCSIVVYQEQHKLLKTQNTEEREDLDAFMENLQGNGTKIDKTEIRKLRLEEQRLKSEQQKVERLIRIAKPIDLPFIKPIVDEAQTNIMVAQKKQLPLIGKRNQFSKFKIIKIEPTLSKVSKPASFIDSEEEEVQEEENHDVKESAKLKIEKKLDNKNFLENINNIQEIGTSQPSNTDKIPNKISNEAIEPLKAQEKIEANNSIDVLEKEVDEIPKSSSKDAKKSTETIQTDGEALSKKRRHRIRQRGKRCEVDIDDDVEYESTDKYAKWVPPENQTGDGFTDLNEKFGY